MIKSMTGFGRCEVVESNRKFTVEIKTVNHRYLDVNIKMPKTLNFFESAIRMELKNYISRGKVDVFVAYEDNSENTAVIRYHKEVAEEYLRCLEQMSEDFGLDNDVHVSALSKYPEVLTLEENSVDEEELWKELKKAVDGAAKMLVETRITEGERLKSDLMQKLDGMLKLADFVAERAPEVVSEYQDRLKEKVRDLLEDTTVDESRLMTEVAIFADRVCVDEEIVRLRSHIEATRVALSEGGPVGRKLDFIAQEMNREANTILSKANDLELSGCAIEMKTEIEKIREQIQNIE